MAALALCLLIQCCFLRVFGWGNIRKRADGSPSTLNVPVTAAHGRYSVDVSMSSVFNFSFALSTSTGWNSVAGSTCNQCNGVPLYNSSKSTTVQSYDPGLNTVAYDPTKPHGGVGTIEKFVREDCTLSVSNAPGWSYPNQSIIVTNQSSSVLSNGCSGILGLGTNKGIGRFSDSIYGGLFIRKPSMTNFSFGMALKPLNSPSDGDDLGVLHWRNPDPLAYKGQPVYKPVATAYNSTPSSTLSSDWTIPMDNWLSSINGQLVNPLSNDGLMSTIDPFYPNLYFPAKIVQSMLSSVSGVNVQQDNDALANIYTVPCDTQVSLTLTFGSQAVTLGKHELISEVNGICTLAIEGWQDVARSDYLLGAKFASLVYLIFRIVASGSQPDMVGIAALPSSSLSKGGVAGIAVGCTVILASAAMAVLYFCLRARWKPISTKSMAGHPPFSPTAVALLAASSPASEGFPITPLPSSATQGSFANVALSQTHGPNRAVSEVQGEPLPSPPPSQAHGAPLSYPSVPQLPEVPSPSQAPPQTPHSPPPAYLHPPGPALMSVSRTPRPS